ncbi:MAG: alpha/beta hydrolase [Burkholderiaceae bacterium]
MIGKLALIDTRPVGRSQVLSGVHSHNPKVYGRLCDEGCDKSAAFIVIHPSSNFMGHYLLEPMQRRGRAILGLNTQFVGNDTYMSTAAALKDLGAGVRFLREQGYRHVCLIGNSGGAALTSWYQAEAEQLTLTRSVDGEPIDLSPADLPPVDSIALVAPHPGRCLIISKRLDAAMVDEDDLLTTDPELDIFNPDNGPPFSSAFVEKIRAAQLARNRRITAWCQARLELFRGTSTIAPITDQPFIIHRSHADPRFLDPALEPSDRKPGTSYGNDVRKSNFAANSLGRISTVRAWLDQWSYDLARTNGPQALARTTVPVLINYFTADQTTFPSDIQAWQQAAGPRGERIDYPGVPHYPYQHPEQLERLADRLADWVAR